MSYFTRKKFSTALYVPGRSGVKIDFYLFYLYLSREESIISKNCLIILPR